ncbi:hypothetical protein [Polaribacter aquimarinus]|uniref:Sensor of ECF-type sigma factor n=1 Tax=Polaribacter aquimarinus TaxID=2100726 RepID=A0A2U2J9V6_9FLAO|nr:hypothetical protein [Polaribacter aquimarinus]PWG05120.1 hypothetical protein DIS07_07685 [Polaribacter aquimarinus]
MKKYILIILVLVLSTVTINAQKRKNKEKIKALKVAFLTQELNLDTKTAQKFWPLYNEHENNLDVLRRKGMLDIKNKLKNAGGLEALTEEESKFFVQSKIKLDKKELVEKEKFLEKISKVLSYKQILKLQLSQREFARKLMRKYRKQSNNK